jgi:hypothetical protein
MNSLARVACSTVIVGLFSSVANAGSLYIVSECAPIYVLAGIGPISSSSPIFIDGKHAGNLRICDVVHKSVAPGNHNIRVELMGKSSFGISSEAGMNIPVGSGPTYVQMSDNYFWSARVVDPRIGQRLVSDIKAVRGN